MAGLPVGEARGQSGDPEWSIRWVDGQIDGHRIEHQPAPSGRVPRCVRVHEHNVTLPPLWKPYSIGTSTGPRRRLRLPSARDPKGSSIVRSTRTQGGGLTHRSRARSWLADTIIYRARELEVFSHSAGGREEQPKGRRCKGPNRTLDSEEGGVAGRPSCGPQCGWRGNVRARYSGRRITRSSISSNIPELLS